MKTILHILEGNDKRSDLKMNNNNTLHNTENEYEGNAFEEDPSLATSDSF
jgi:hypothetical protein